MATRARVAGLAVTGLLAARGLTSGEASGATPWGAPSIVLGELPLEDLLNLEVTSVTRRRQPLSESAGAVTVITQEDIRRLGMG